MEGFSIAVTKQGRNIGLLFTKALEWVGTAVDTVVSEPILFVLVVAVPLVGLGVGLFKRLMDAN